MLAPPGGFARAETRSSVTTCDVYPQPFVVLVVMVFIFTVFFHIKCVCFRSRLHTMFSDAIDHWMFWPCPNVIFFSPNLAEKFTITCNLQRIHFTRFAMHAVWWSLTWCILLRIGGISLPPLLSRWQQLSLSILDELHEANVMVNIKWNKVIR